MGSPALTMALPAEPPAAPPVTWREPADMPAAPGLATSLQLRSDAHALEEAPRLARLAIDPLPSPGTPPDVPLAPLVPAPEPAAEGTEGSERPSRAPDATPLPPPRTARQEPAEIATAAELAPAPEEPGVEALADASSPLPKPRPAGLAAAAGARGMSLDRTALIGIMSLDSGRKALLRLPDGQVRTVAVGDVLDGWRVNAIGVDALRVSRAGADRTLLLVTR